MSRSSILQLWVPALLVFAACSDSRPIPGPSTSTSRDASAGRDGATGPALDASTDASSGADGGGVSEDAMPTMADASNGDALALDGGSMSGADAASDGGTPSDGGSMAGDAGPQPVSYVESAIAAPPWIDACAMGSSLGLTDPDDGHATMPSTLPFVFSFFGSTVTQVWPDTNGYLTFDVEPLDGYDPIFPDLDEGAGVFPFWDDLVLTNASASICVAVVGAAPNRSMVIEWLDASNYNAKVPEDTHLTFEVVLHETTNVVEIVYQTLSAPMGDEPLVDGTTAAIGGQSAAAAESFQHVGTVSIGTGLRFTP